MNLKKNFINFITALIATHLVHSLMIGTPWIGIMIWSAPVVFFAYKGYVNPTARLYQIFGFIILIYFMSICLIVFGLPNAGFLSWLELIEIVCLFFITVYAAREQLNVK